MDEIKKNIWSSRVLNVIGKQIGESALELTLLRDVLRATSLRVEELAEVLADLQARGFIETGRTINDTYIRLTK